MPHRIDGIDLDVQQAYADSVRCPGRGTFAAPQMHSRPSRLTYSGRGTWGCTGCGRLWNSPEVSAAQQRVRELDQGECAAV